MTKFVPHSRAQYMPEGTYVGWSCKICSGGRDSSQDKQKTSPLRPRYQAPPPSLAADGRAGGLLSDPTPDPCRIPEDIGNRAHTHRERGRPIREALYGTRIIPSPFTSSTRTHRDDLQIERPKQRKGGKGEQNWDGGGKVGKGSTRKQCMHEMRWDGEVRK